MSVVKKPLPPTARGKSIDLARRMLQMIANDTSDLAPEALEIDVEQYADTNRYHVECEKLYRERPIFAGFSSEVAEPGDYKTLSVPSFPLLIVRGNDGQLRAFLNACRHRGSALTAGTGRVGAFVCPYHGWAYELDGSLRAVRSAERFGAVDTACRGLIEVSIGEAHGLMFVCCTPLSEGSTAVDVDKALGGLGPQIGEWQFEKTQAIKDTVIDVASNWKLAVNTYLETYHFGVLHPRTVARTHFSDYATFDTYEENQLTGFVGRDIERLKEQAESDWEPLRHLQFIYFLFPNTVLTVMRDHTEYFQTFPGSDVGESHTNYVYFTYPEYRFNSEDVANDRFERELSILIEEDCPMAENMQRSIDSGALKTFLFGRNEPGLQHFHRSIDAALMGSPS